MYYLAHSMTELCHSRQNRDVKWEGVPVDYGAGKECILVTVFKCWDLPVRQLVVVS